MTSWRDMTIRPEAPLVEAIKIIDSGGGQIAIVVGESDRLEGVVTDADIRKAILRGSNFQEPCTTYMTATPIVMKPTASKAEMVAVMRRRHIRQLPLVDDTGRVVDVVLLSDVVATDLLPNPVVLMAGGLGSRLGALTTHMPKPMLPVGMRPLLETILLQLIDQGFHKFYFSVNYKAELIMDHFGDGSRWDVTIDYLREKERLGTGGALRLLPPGLTHEILVMNGDILTKVDMRQMLAMHNTTGAGLTVAVKDYVFNVPYGVVSIDDHGLITSFREKPSHRFFVNAGIYVLSQHVLKFVPPEGKFDLPSLFEPLAESKIPVASFPIREYWMDIGLPTDYERASAEYDIHFSVI